MAFTLSKQLATKVTATHGVIEKTEIDHKSGITRHVVALYLNEQAHDNGGEPVERLTYEYLQADSPVAAKEANAVRAQAETKVLTEQALVDAGA